jgi:hypothetical protein
VLKALGLADYENVLQVDLLGVRRRGQSVVAGGLAQGAVALKNDCASDEAAGKKKRISEQAQGISF